MSVKLEKKWKGIRDQIQDGFPEHALKNCQKGGWLGGWVTGVGQRDRHPLQIASRDVHPFPCHPSISAQSRSFVLSN